MIHTIHSSYLGAEGRSSAFDLTYSSIRKSSNLVLFLHGYKGFKDWGPWFLVAETFANQGFDFLKFNFSHNGGTVENPIDFPDLEAFANNTYSKEIEDLKCILEMVSNGIPLGDEVANYDNIYLIGHSRGGGIAVLGANRFHRFEKMATWASVADFGERFNFDQNDWKKTGVAYVQNSRTGQELPHNYRFYTDFIENQDQLNVLKSASEIRIPWLIAHGSEDEAVSLEDASRLSEANPKALTFIVESTGHTFGGKHPQDADEMPLALQSLVNRTIGFFKD